MVRALIWPEIKKGAWDVWSSCIFKWKWICPIIEGDGGELFINLIIEQISEEAVNL